MEEIPVSDLEEIYQTCKVLAEHTGETELVPMIKSILAENEALRTKLARFKKWNSQLTAKCNWYNCDGARLEREIEALKQQVEQGKRDAVPEGLNECVARAIYMQWRDAQGYLHWQDGGNSLMQDSARRVASAAIAAALKQEK